MMKPSFLGQNDSEVASRKALENMNCEIFAPIDLLAPGFIQPYSGILVLRHPELTVCQASENIETLLNIPIAELLGCHLKQIFSIAQYKRITEQLSQVYSGLGTAFELTVNCSTESTQTHPGQVLLCQLHPIEDGVILELEPQAKPLQFSPLYLYNHLQQAIQAFRHSTDVPDLARQLAHHVAEMMEFDRVMVYQFMEDHHGVVIAEERRADLEPYLGLHFPAFDIPEAARDLFSQKWIRMIPDVKAVPAKLVPSLPEQPIDLSTTNSRGVSPCHVKYLNNMGVTATFAISLVIDQQLWGLVTCHHYHPKVVSYERRKTCELLGQLASVELMNMQSRELNQYQQQVRFIQQELQRAFLAQPDFIDSVLHQYQQQVCDLVHAPGAAIALGQDILLIGNTPPRAEVQALIAWLKEHHPAAIFSTHTLSDHYPPARGFKDTASGLLAISVSLSQGHHPSYHILWFRPEQIQMVDWAGNPESAITVNEQGEVWMSPRTSFVLWQETVRDQSIPWQSVEVSAAMEMRNTLMLAALEFSQIALEAEAKRAELANQAKSRFLAHMSHELRTPLNAILGFTQIMLRNDAVPPELYDPLNIIGRSGEHLLILINDVLEMSKIEAGQIELYPRCFDLETLVVSIYEMFSFKAAEKGLSLMIDRGDRLPRYVVGDEVKLRQILINLVSNALKFTERGSVTFRVTSQSVDQHRSDLHNPDQAAIAPTCILQFDVMDTGCGIPAHEQNAVFDAFRQTDQGRSAQGTGLGLPISRQFARLMEGDITVVSSPKGSTFTCQVQVQVPDALDLVELTQPADVPQQRVVGLEPGQPTYRILVVEDIFENRELLNTLLQSVGFEVAIAKQGEEAIQMWQAWQPHLILMDIQMPILDGVQATQRIRELETAQPFNEEADSSQPTWIIALTASVFYTDRDRCLQAGCNDYLAKPFNPDHLFAVIGGYLGIRYRYETIEALPQPQRDLQPLSPQSFQSLPTAWCEALREAALDLDDSALYGLVAEIAPTEATLANQLTNLVDNFQFEAIAQLVSPHVEEALG